MADTCSVHGSDCTDELVRVQFHYRSWKWTLILKLVEQISVLSELESYAYLMFLWLFAIVNHECLNRRSEERLTFHLRCEFEFTLGSPYLLEDFQREVLAILFCIPDVSYGAEADLLDESVTCSILHFLMQFAFNI